MTDVKKLNFHVKERGLYSSYELHIISDCLFFFIWYSALCDPSPETHLYPGAFIQAELFVMLILFGRVRSNTGKNSEITPSNLFIHLVEMKRFC